MTAAAQGQRGPVYLGLVPVMYIWCRCVRLYNMLLVYGAGSSGGGDVQILLDVVASSVSGLIFYISDVHRLQGEGVHILHKE